MENKRILIIFDKKVHIKALVDSKTSLKNDALSIFPLKEDMFDITIPDKFNRNIINLINSANAINQQVNILREKIVKWSADIGNYKTGNKKIKERLLLPGSNISSWWFSLISEKNTLKTSSFFDIAKINAVENELDIHNYDFSIIAVSDAKLRTALKSLLKNKGIPFELAGTRITQMLAGKLDFFREILMGLLTIIRFAQRSLQVKKFIKSFPNRSPQNNSLLFVSYFPSLDREALKDGIFHNRYYAPLQTKLQNMNIPVAWLLIYVRLDGYSFREALDIAGKLIARGEKMFFAYEFLEFKDILKALLLWIRQFPISLILYRQSRNQLLQDPIGNFNEPFVKSLWYKSFCGPIGIESILYYFIFKRAFQKLNNVSDCVYLAEMQAWEKALNAAKNQISPSLRTIGFQHTSVSKNLFHYFYDPVETKYANTSVYELPLPDVLAANGDTVFSLLQQSGYPGLVPVEAIRHIYVSSILSSENNSIDKKPMLLIIGSYSRTESIALINLVITSFPKAGLYDIRFKEHPGTPLEKLFIDLKVDLKETGFQIADDNLLKNLSAASAVLVYSSTVAMEALAVGCEVIIPLLTESMLINPLAEFEGYYHLVNSPNELTQLMDKITKGHKLNEAFKSKQLIRKYWYTDPALPKWERLLSKQKQNVKVF